VSAKVYKRKHLLAIASDIESYRDSTYQGMEKVLAKRFMLYIEKPSILKIEG